MYAPIKSESFTKMITFFIKLTSCYRPKNIAADIKKFMVKYLENTINKVDWRQFDRDFVAVVNIIISYDMGRTKRGNGRSYDSLKGYGTILGFLSVKVLDCATRIRKCGKCDRGCTKSHNTRKN